MKQYKHLNGDLLEVTEEYNVRFIDPERGYFLADNDILIYEDLSRIIYKNPITKRGSTVALRSYPGEKSPKNGDGDLTDGKLSLQQSILGNPANKGGAYHFYLRDNKFYPCYMCNYKQGSDKGVQGGDGKGENYETQKA